MIFNLKLGSSVKQNLRLCIENQGSNFLDLSPAGLEVSEEQAVGMRSDILWQMKRGNIAVEVTDGQDRQALTASEFEVYTSPAKRDEPPV